MVISLLLSVVSFATTTTVSITDVGGVGDGVTSNTAAFVRAVAKLKATKGGGTLLVPASSSSSSTFLTGPFNLSSHITLLVEGGATILGSTNLTEWPLMPPMPSYGQGRDHPGPRRVSLIHGTSPHHYSPCSTDVCIWGKNELTERTHAHTRTHTHTHIYICIHICCAVLNHAFALTDVCLCICIFAWVLADEMTLLNEQLYTKASTDSY